MIQNIGYHQGGYWEPSKNVNNAARIGTANSFSALLQHETAKTTAKEFLATLKTNELAELQKISHLADPIDVSKLSEEGARNLLAKGDKTKYVDLNNDGITEIGIGKSFVFPPPNAPQAVKDAWEKITANMSFKERMLAEAPFLVEQLIANIHQRPDGSYQVVESGQPGYINPFAGGVSNYCNLLDRMIERLMDQIRRNSGSEFKQNWEFQLGVLQDFLKNIQINNSNNES